MDPRLEEASHAGDLAALHCLLQEDRLLLHKLSATTPSVANNPLHIAALLGHVDFVREVLRLNPDLAQDTNVDGLTSLHLASARGHLPVVRELINMSAGSDLCRIHDRDGFMPVHTAAVRGRVPVLQALLEKSPELLEELLSGGETILHCAVKSGCYEALQILVERMSANQASILLNSKDDMGNTILHLAAARRQLQTLRMFLTKPELNVNELNVRGLTALDVILESPNQNGDLTLARMIMVVGGKTSSEVHPQQPVPLIPGHISHPQTSFQNSLRLMLRVMRWLGLTPASQLPNSEEEPSQSSGTLIVVATLIATITFQPIMSPPGGFDSNTGYVTRGNALSKFLVFDIIGLFSSLSVILLLLSVEHRRKKKLMKFLVWVVWVAAYSTALAFTSAAYTVFPNSSAVTVFIYVWFVIIDLTVLWIYLRITVYMFIMVGWWDMNSLRVQTDLKGALFMKRCVVATVVVAIPVLIVIIGPDFVVSLLFVCNMDSSNNFYVFTTVLLHVWAVAVESPIVYIGARFILYLVGILGRLKESRISRSRSRVSMEEVWISSLLGPVILFVLFHVYYVSIAAWNPNSVLNTNFENFRITCD